MGWAPTTEQILNLDGVRRRVDGFRFDLLNSRNEVIGSLSPDRDRAPQVSNDTGRDVHRTLSNFHLPASELTDINVVSNRVKAWMVLQDGTEYSLGVFLWGDDSRPERGWGSERYSSLVDQTLILNQDTIGSIGWTAGVNMPVVLVYLLRNAGFSENDIARSELEATATLSEPVSYPPGTSRLRIMADICQMAGLAAPWFDRDGGMNFTRPPDPTTTAPALTYGLGGRIIADSIVRSDDLLKAPNYFTVYDTGVKSTRRGSYRLPADAPHSIENRGFRVALVESAQGLQSNAAARSAARTLALTKGVAYDWISWSSTADPRHDTWDVVSVLDENWLETSWSLTCRSGAPMTHVGKKVYRDDS